MDQAPPAGIRELRAAPVAARRVLVVAPSWIGDTLMAQPLLTRLKAAQPDSQIEVLAADWSAPLLERMTEVDAIISNPFAHGEFHWRARRALGRQLAVRGYTSAYVLPNSWKSALVPFFAGIPERIGYQGEARYGLLNRRHRLDPQAMPRLVERYAALADPLPSAAPLPLPRLGSTAEQQATARLALGLPAQGAPLVLCPGAEYGPAKRWPSRHFAALAARLASPDAPAWILGSAKDAAVGEEIAALAGGAALNLCGRTSLAQVIDLIACARAVVSNDSGLMHVAAALGRPLAAIYGSSSPEYTPPLAANAAIVSRRLPCSPCFKRECPLGHLDCLAGLSADAVIAALPH